MFEWNQVLENMLDLIRTIAYEKNVDRFFFYFKKENVNERDGSC